MANESIVTVTGLDDIARNLRSVTDKVRDRSSRKATAAGAQVIARRARANAATRSKSGTLQRSIVSTRNVRLSKRGVIETSSVRPLRGRRYASREVLRNTKAKRRPRGKMSLGKRVVMTKSRDAFYARWVEEGHRIVARYKGKYEDYKQRGKGRLHGLTLRRRDAAATGRRVRAYPFLAPAFNASIEEAKQALTNTMRKELESVR